MAKSIPCLQGPVKKAQVIDTVKKSRSKNSFRLKKVDQNIFYDLFVSSEDTFRYSEELLSKYEGHIEQFLFITGYKMGSLHTGLYNRSALFFIF